MSDAAAFVERFTRAWAAPDPEGLNGLLHPDVRLVQPLEGELRGHDAAAAMWRRTLATIPDLRGDVLDWAERDGFLVVAVRLHGTLGGRPIEWVTSDHIRLDDEGRVTERIAMFDPLPIVATLLARPRAWLPYLRVQLGRLRGAS